MRTSSETVTFSHPFVLTAIAGVQMAGTYLVEKDEEQLPTSYAAFRRVATWIHLPAQLNCVGLTEAVVQIDPAELARLLTCDMATASAPPQVASGDASKPGALGLPGQSQHSPGAAVDGLARLTLRGFKHWCSLNANELTWTALLIGLAAVAEISTRG